MVVAISRVAVFVDAGYLYSAGSAAIFGSRQRQQNLELSHQVTLTRLRETAEIQTGNANLLRIYWYDGALHSGASEEQQRLADNDDVKVRLGAINFAGQQKGVDSLIVTDLIELARNHAVSDAVLLSGDEDVRVGVQIAQSFGVRVHLIGIEPSRGNQSRLLRQEVDTKTEWSRDDVARVLSLKPGFDIAIGVPADAGAAELSVPTSRTLDQAVETFITTLTEDELVNLTETDLTTSIPREYDGRLLRNGGGMLGRRLEYPETRYLRDKFKEAIRHRV